MVSISFGKSNFSEIQNSYQMTVALIMMFVVLCSISSIIVSVKTSSSQGPVPIKREVEEPEDVAVVPAEIKDLDSEIFSIDSEVTMYEQCNSNSKIIASAAMNIVQALSSELTLERNSITNTTFRDGTLANEKVRRIEVKNVEILPGSKWTVVNDGRETTIVLDLPQSYEGNQLLNIGSECSDNTKSYILHINLIYIPIKLDVKEKNEVEGYRI
tara:strand:- start:310 stop:951 length:642 start_codon:yes stop_codon:yes gene_type:complete